MKFFLNAIKRGKIVDLLGRRESDKLTLIDILTFDYVLFSRDIGNNLFPIKMKVDVTEEYFLRL